MCLEEPVAFVCNCGLWGRTGIPTCVEDLDGAQYYIGFGNPDFYDMGFVYCELPDWAATGSVMSCP
jgi:hypothetical protein